MHIDSNLFIVIYVFTLFRTTTPNRVVSGSGEHYLTLGSSNVVVCSQNIQCVVVNFTAARVLWGP